MPVLQGNLENFIALGAERMAADNTAGWDKTTCEARLRSWIDTLMLGDDIETVGSGSWLLYRIPETTFQGNSAVEYALMRQVLDYYTSDDSELDSQLFDWS